MKCPACTKFWERYKCGAALTGECDCPKCQGFCTCPSGFDRFWSAWPKSVRKGAKSACKAKWDKHYLETCADQIIKHVECMKTTDQWRTQNGAFIPAPLVYLNQQRWDGAEIPDLETGPDPVLEKIKEDKQKAAPMPAAVRAQLRRLASI